MVGEMLEKARAYELEKEKEIAREERPLFHLTPRTGWMNDPNGFSRYGGKYHMFYQYHPYASHWDSMHWGHAVSDDLLKWEYRPAALAPDEEYDSFGCFSGSAIDIEDGRQLLMYTGVRVFTDDNGVRHEFQTQNIAIGDGVDYKKYENNPVITSEKIPENASKTDFRDPKIWRTEDGGYIAAIGSRPADGSGQILLYRSKDGFEWNYWKVLIANGCRYGKMWECPDFFKLDNKWVLLVSPQDMLAEGYEFINGNGTLCVIGDFDEKTGEFTAEHFQSIDYGIDFYAPQTVLSEDGRRLMIGWMQNWDACSIREGDAKWAGQMSMPRELFLKEGRLCQKPAKEIESLRGKKCEYHDVKIDKSISFEGINGRCLDIDIKVRPQDADGVYKSFEIRFAEDENFYTSLKFVPESGVLEIDRMHSGSRRALIHQRKSLVENSKNRELELRVILDRYSAEIFVNGGEKVITTAIYTPLTAERVSFSADGEASIDITSYKLSTN